MTKTMMIMVVVVVVMVVLMHGGGDGIVVVWVVVVVVMVLRWLWYLFDQLCMAIMVASIDHLIDKYNQSINLLIIDSID